jgi:hypothetical protein
MRQELDLCWVSMQRSNLKVLIGTKLFTLLCTSQNMSIHETSLTFNLIYFIRHTQRETEVALTYYSS